MDPRFNPAKPLAIIAVCVIGFINATQMLNLVFSPMTKQLGGIYPAYFGVSVLVSVLCLLGLWMMKRWAALAYIAVLVANQAVLLATGFWEISALIMPLLMVGLLLKHLAAMSS